MLQNYKIKVFGRKFSAGEIVLATQSLKDVLLERMLPLKLTIPRSEREEKPAILEGEFLQGCLVPL